MGSSGRGTPQLALPHLLPSWCLEVGMIAGAPAANFRHEITLKIEATDLVDGAQDGRSPDLDEHGAANSGQL